jgi:pilus assembly protein CpaE
MNVLLIASDATLADMLRAVGLRVTAAGQPALSELARAGSRAPELLVIDHHGTGSLPDVLGQIRRQHPAMGILVVLSELDGARVLEAMRAGVSECLAHPVQEDDLRAAIGRIQASRPAAKKGEIVAVVGAKGGVGATTLAVNIASSLAKDSGASTLLMDLHVTYGDAAVFMGIEPRFSVADAFNNIHRLDAAVLRGLVTKTPSGADLLPSSERSSANTPDVLQVRSLVDLAATQYGYLVLDVPRSSPALLEALEGVGTVLLVANQELSSVRSASRLSTALQQRYGREHVHLVVNRFDERAEISVEDVERVTGLKVRHTFPNNYASALACQTAGRPLVMHSNSKLATTLASFTRTLAGIAEPTPIERPGLFSRIGRPLSVKS